MPLTGGRGDVRVSASLFRGEGTTSVLLRLAPLAPVRPERVAVGGALDVIQRMPGGFVVTDAARRILTANGAFLDLTQHATEEQVLEAARATYVDRFVHSLPDGYETVIDEEGGSLSAGERQLVTIARAFLTDPALLILDEATSSVDTRTEVLVQQAMAALRRDRTSFVIAHRLSTIRDAEVILVMEDGAIVEQGDHAALLAADGAYARLYAAQFEAAADPV